MLADSAPCSSPLSVSLSLCWTVQMSNKRKSLQSSDSSTPPLNWLLQCCLPELTPENKTRLHTRLWSGVCNTQMQLTRQQTNRKWKAAAGQWRLSMWPCCCRNWLPISRRASTGLDWARLDFPYFFPAWPCSKSISWKLIVYACVCEGEGAGKKLNAHII